VKKENIRNIAFKLWLIEMCGSIVMRKIIKYEINTREGFEDTEIADYWRSFNSTANHPAPVSRKFPQLQLACKRRSLHGAQDLLSAQPENSRDGGGRYDASIISKTRPLYYKTGNV
jgi:hypothetical protein